MALRSLYSPTILAGFASPAALISTRSSFFFQQLLRPILYTPIAIPLVLPIGIPKILNDLWESVLRAVPKKKTSHRKKRQRFLAGKALQDVTALNKCSACGNIKRAHLLCPFCVAEIRGMWKDPNSTESNKAGEGSATAATA